MPLPIRVATPSDLDFLVDTDLRADNDHRGPLNLPATTIAAHRTKLTPFVTQPNHIALLTQPTTAADPIALLMARFRDPQHEPDIPQNRFLLDKVFATLDPRWLPADGRFTEVFQLWVDPNHRLRGLATELKQHLEQLSRDRNISLLYTHTLATYEHVVHLNEALGYEQVRVGPLWDEHLRVSLVKRLD